MTKKPVYQNLEDIQLRKDELHTEIAKQSEAISTLWSGLFTPKKASTKGEQVASLITNSITVIDMFLLVRKLMNQYGSLFGRKKKKR